MRLVLLPSFLVALSFTSAGPSTPDEPSLAPRSSPSSHPPSSFKIPFTRHKRHSTRRAARKAARLKNSGLRKELARGQDDVGKRSSVSDGGPDYEYSITVSIGTPPQNLQLQLDTGSSLLAVYGPDWARQYPSLSDGTKRGKPFYQTQSSTFIDADREVQFSYADGSQFIADIAQDRVVIGGLVQNNTVFGVMTEGNFSTPGSSVSGILGLAWSGETTVPEQDSSYYGIPPLEQLWRLGAFKEPLFTFALLRNNLDPAIASTSESAGGIFTTGELDTAQFKGNVSYKPLTYGSYSTAYPSTWSAHIDSIKVNGKPVQGSTNMTAIFDTGSAVSTLPAPILQNMFAQVPNSVQLQDGSYLTECPIPGQGVSPFNMSITWNGEDYAIDYSDLATDIYRTTDNKIVCNWDFGTPGYDADGDDDSNGVVIGLDFLKNVFSVFRFSPPSIGFARLSDDVLKSERTYAPLTVVQNFGESFGAPAPIPTTSLRNDTPYQGSTVYVPTDLATTFNPGTSALPAQPAFAGPTSMPSPVASTADSASAVSQTRIGSVSLVALIALSSVALTAL